MSNPRVFTYVASLRVLHNSSFVNLDEFPIAHRATKVETEGLSVCGTAIGKPACAGRGRGIINPQLHVRTCG